LAKRHRNTRGSAATEPLNHALRFVSKEQEQIFEPGGRGLAGRTNGDGAGLGLALARRLARTVTGGVTVAHQETGATFVVRLSAA
jgi:signal transduction histidine kinase